MLDIADLYSGYNKLEILHGINLKLGERKVYALFGPNGAGKSTLAKTLFGLLPMEKGDASFNGIDLRGQKAEQRRDIGMGYVPQESNVFPTLSINDNIRVAVAGIQGVTWEQACDSTYELFPRLAERQSQIAGTLSGGERQILAMACAVAHEPKFLLVDEPTSGLSPIIVDRVIEETLEIASRGVTILWLVGDDAVKILPHVHRCYLMQSGVIAGDWLGSELVDSNKLRDLYFNES